MFQLVATYIAMFKRSLAAASSALIVTGTALQDGSVTNAEWTAIVAAWLAVYGVFKLVNKKPQY